MTCTICNKPIHSQCSNGHVIISDTTVAECPNLRIVRILDDFNRRIPASFREVKMAKHTPLYVPRGENVQGVDMTGQNLFIRGVPWNPVFVSHLKKVFFCKPLLTFKLVTDARIKDVWLGAEAYTSMPKGKREEAETHNVISDLVSENYDLVVIHLGQLMHKNVAAPNVLKEALMFRGNLGLKTWLFQSSDPGAGWLHSRNDEVEEYVNSKFELVDLSDQEPSPIALLPPAKPYQLLEHASDIGYEEEETAPEAELSFVPVETRGSASENLEDILSGYGKKKVKPKKWRKS